MSTRKDFSNAVLKGLGVFQPRDNLLALGARRAIVSWSVSESGHEPCNGQHNSGASFNILNTSLYIGNCTSPTVYNSIPIQNYLSFNCGVLATVQTLEEPRYAAIKAALVTPGVKAETVLVAVGHSVWGTPLESLLAVLNTTYSPNRAFYNNLTVGV